MRYGIKKKCQTPELKELEYLEKICEKVGEISVNGSAGIVEQLGKMMGA